MRDSFVAKYQRDDRVTVVPPGLSDDPGTATLCEYPDQPRLSSIVRYPHKGQVPSEVEVVATTGDQIVQSQAFAVVDLLKIDVGSFELSILRGFATGLHQRAIRLIQFEYGRSNLNSWSLLLEFYRFLEPLGYGIGEVKPGRVEFADYSPARENCFLTNCAAKLLDSKPEIVN